MDNQNNKCENENLIRQLVKVQAQVSVVPDVRHGTPRVSCIDSCIKPNPHCFCEEDCDFRCCDRKCRDYKRCWHNKFNCSFESDYDDCCNENTDFDLVSAPGRKHNYTLTQVICIEIPISLGADVEIKEGIACCGKPEIQSADDISNKKRPYYMQMI